MRWCRCLPPPPPWFRTAAANAVTSAAGADKAKSPSKASEGADADGAGGADGAKKKKNGLEFAFLAGDIIVQGRVPARKLRRRQAQRSKGPGLSLTAAMWAKAAAKSAVAVFRRKKTEKQKAEEEARHAALHGPGAACPSPAPPLVVSVWWSCCALGVCACSVGYLGRVVFVRVGG